MVTMQTAQPFKRHSASLSSGSLESETQVIIRLLQGWQLPVLSPEAWKLVFPVCN